MTNPQVPCPIELPAGITLVSSNVSPVFMLDECAHAVLWVIEGEPPIYTSIIAPSLADLTNNKYWTDMLEQVMIYRKNRAPHATKNPSDATKNPSE